MKKDVKRLWNEMRAAEHAYRDCVTEDKPRMYIRRLAAIHKYHKFLEDSLEKGHSEAWRFREYVKTIMSKISGARHMKELMERCNGN